jgi:isoleucyl-tRNA synthetase
MRGFRTPYVPGWDCHGLPIEQKVSKEIKEQNLTLTTAEMRAKCDEFSESWIAKQTIPVQARRRPRRLEERIQDEGPGLRGRHRPHLRRVRRAGSRLPQQEARLLVHPVRDRARRGGDRIQGPRLHRHLGEVSPCRWPRPPRSSACPTDKPLFVVIWTTTPVDDPRQPRDRPASLKSTTSSPTLGAERIIVASALLGSVAQLPRSSSRSRRRADAARRRAGKACSRAIPSSTAPRPSCSPTMSRPTAAPAAVHTAPGHGAEDYQTGLKYKLEIYCPVGDDGRYLDDGRCPPTSSASPRLRRSRISPPRSPRPPTSPS